jgi:pSer/pThr/pTyr-binding forkhead associated (FHA) protein
MGRGRDNDIVVSDTFASTTHASIECRGDRFYLVDRSSNGTFVGDQGMRDELVSKRETLLFGSGLIGLGRSPATEADRCIRFEIQLQT